MEKCPNCRENPVAVRVIEKRTSELVEFCLPCWTGYMNVGGREFLNNFLNTEETARLHEALNHPVPQT